MNAKAVYLNIGLTISTKQTSISPATVTLITILEVNQSTDHTLESTKNITLTENTTADPSIPHDDNVTPIQLTSDTAENLKSLSEDTFMTNSLTNGAHDQIADPPDKEATDDYPITVSAALDNLMIILDETSLSHPNNDKTTEEDAPIIYNAYVKLSDIEEYFAVDNKIAYIEILTRDFRGFMGIDINKEDNEIIVKNSSYKGMLHMKSGLKPSKNNPNTITVFITVKDLDKITGSLRDYNINWPSRNKKLAKIPTPRPTPPDKLVSITHHEDKHHIEIRQEEHHKFSHIPYKHKSKNKQRHTSKPPHPRNHNTHTMSVTGFNAVALAKRVKGTTDTSAPSTIISGGYDALLSFNSSTNHNDGIVEGNPVTLETELSNQGQDLNTLVPHHTDNNTTSLISPSLTQELESFLQRERIEFINNNLDCMDHSDTYEDCSYELRGSSKLNTKQKGSGVALLIHSKWQRFHIGTEIFSPFLMTLQFFEQTMNNTTSDSHIIHIWMGDTNRYFDHSLDVYSSTSDKKKDIPLCFNHLNLIDSFRYLNPDTKEFFWHHRSQDDALRIDIRIDHIWIQRHISPSLRSAHHYEGHTLTNSDHDIVTINIYLPDIFPIAYKNTQPITPHDPNFRDLSIKTEDITSDHWTNFEAHISDSAHTFDSLINTLNSMTDPLDSSNYSQRAMETIDKCWADIKEILISATTHTLPLRKRNKLHPKLKPKDRSSDMKKLDKHTIMLLTFIHDIHLYQVNTHNDPTAFSQLKDRWDSHISSFNNDYIDNRELQFDMTFILDSLNWLSQLKQVAQKRVKVEQKAYTLYQTSKITAAVEARFATIQSAQTRWISSSLERRKPNVTID
ncbi:hypothetical protein RCL_jg21785.t1 [Rhizophagus clarus]|uniref:Endonuclease/exonuclease/phosphatase domain-containing protein n=1 Tax=Rhizophagus clarus TaxID=94130 RepID=A0A8H3L3V7_9GLOM|nr:hypothetical protein RCL_jg21785.t1 [Rhizophagus clarus]